MSNVRSCTVEVSKFTLSMVLSLTLVVRYVIVNLEKA